MRCMGVRVFWLLGSGGCCLPLDVLTTKEGTCRQGLTVVLVGAGRSPCTVRYVVDPMLKLVCSPNSLALHLPSQRCLLKREARQ